MPQCEWYSFNAKKSIWQQQCRQSKQVVVYENTNYQWHSAQKLAAYNSDQRHFEWTRFSVKNFSSKNDSVFVINKINQKLLRFEYLNKWILFFDYFKQIQSE